MKLPADDPRAVAFVESIRAGDVGAVERLLAEDGELATARFVDPRCGDERTALHVATDWPGRFTNGRAVVVRLIAAGADMDWIGHDGLTPLEAAVRSDAHELADWLRSQGAHPGRSK